MDINIRNAITQGADGGLSVHIIVWPAESQLHVAPLVADLEALAARYGATIKNTYQAQGPSMFHQEIRPDFQ